MEDRLRRQAISGLRWTGLSQVLTGALQFAQIAILAHWLTPTEFGLMAMVLLVLHVVSAVADAGVSAALIHVQDISDRQRSTLYWLHLGLAAVIGVLLYVAAPAIAWFSGSDALTPMVRASVVSVLFVAIGTQFRMFFHKNLQFGSVSSMEIASTVAQLVVAVVLALHGLGAWALLIGHVVGSFVGMVWMLAVGLPHWKPRFEFETDGLDRFLTYGLYNMGEKLILFLSSRIDQLLITSLFGLQWLGLYNMALNLVIYPIQRINQTVSQVTFPLFARHQDDPDRIRSGYLTVLRVLTLVNAPLLVGIMITAPVFIPLLIGTQWNQSIYLVQVLSLFAYYRSTGSPAGALLLALGRTDLGFHWNLLVTSLTLPVVWWCGQAWGIHGMVWGLVGLHTVLAVLYYPIVIKRLIGETASAYTDILIRPVLYASMMGAVVRSVDLVFASGGYLELVAMVVTGVAVYATLLQVLERPFIRSLIAHIRPVPS